MNTLALSFLGPPRIEADGDPVRLTRRKATALLAYLAVTGRAHSRDTLTALLWPELDQRRARAALRRTLVSLRRTYVRGWIQAEREAIGLARERLWVDVDAFYSLLNRSHLHSPGLEGPEREAALENAVELVQGEFMAGFTLRDSSPFDEWQLQQARELRELVAEALQQLARSLTDRGDYTKAIAYAQRWVMLDSLHEPAHRCLMQLYVEVGRRSAAMRQYQECARVLADELGAEPDAETIALFEGIRDGQIHRAYEVALGSLPAPPRDNLPAQTTPLIGRETELAELDRLLTDPAVRLITILGPGGMGKTRLAIEAAARQRDKMRDGVFFVALAPISELENMVSAIAASVGFTVQDSDRTPRQQLLDYLRSKSMLLLLDNAEHLLAGVDLFSEILKSAPAICLLVTSRERLHLSSESILPLNGLRLSGQTGAGISAAAMLFIQSAQLVRPGFEPTPENWPHLSRVCRLVMGMPLGLVLAASRIEMLSVAEIALEIESSLDFLAADLRDLPERQRSIRAVFESTWLRLSTSERDAFQRLSVFRGGFTRQAAREVGSVSLTTLTALSHKSLIRRNPDGRFEVHELLRQFGADRLVEAGLMSQAQDDHLAFFARFAEEAEPRVNGDQHSADWLERVAREHDNLRAALEWALGNGDFALGMRIVGAIWEFWMNRGHAQEGQVYAERYLARPEASRSTYLCAKTLHTAGVLAFYHGHLDAAIAHLARCISLSRQLDAEGLPLLTMGLVAMGHVSSGNGKLGDVEKLASESLRLGQELDNALVQGHAKLQLAHLCKIQGDMTDAEQHILESIGFFETHGNLGMLGAALFNYSQLLRVQGKYAAARAAAVRSLKVLETTNDANRSATALRHLGAIAVAQGDYQEAEIALSRALQLLRQAGQSRHLMHVLREMGRLAMRQDDCDRAQTMLRESLALSLELNAPSSNASVLEAVACLAARQGCMDVAARFWGAADARATMGEMGLDPTEVSEHEHWVAIARTQLGETAFWAAWSAGSTMTSMEMLEYVAEGH